MKALKDNADLFSPGAYATLFASGAVVAGIGQACSTQLGLPTGWTLLALSALFGATAVVANYSAGTSKILTGLYSLMAAFFLFWQATMTGTTVPGLAIQPVDAQTSFVDRGGNIVVNHPEYGEFRCPPWAVPLICGEAQPQQKQRQFLKW